MGAAGRRDLTISSGRGDSDVLTSDSIGVQGNRVRQFERTSSGVPAPSFLSTQIIGSIFSSCGMNGVLVSVEWVVLSLRNIRRLNLSPFPSDETSLMERRKITYYEKLRPSYELGRSRK